MKSFDSSSAEIGRLTWPKAFLHGNNAPATASDKERSSDRRETETASRLLNLSNAFSSGTKHDPHNEETDGLNDNYSNRYPVNFLAVQGQITRKLHRVMSPLDRISR